MRVSLIITTYNRPDALKFVLQSITSQSQLPNEIIIADDGSNNSTKKCIDEFKKKSSLPLIHSWQEDKGFRVAKSRNKAIAQSKFDYIILIDGDVILHYKFIEDHLKHAEMGFFVQGSRVLLNKRATEELLSNNSNVSFFSRGLSNRKNAIYSNFLSWIFTIRKNYLKNIKTCNLAFFKSDCIEINGFNNDFEGWGREDTEFVVRLIKKGVNRKNIRFNLLQFHLWHEDSSRHVLQKNEIILNDTIKKNKNWCINGINQYL
jgi:glycosyltransferase involved in cell wall biosynthesis